jgi:hypothetical protein
MSLRMAWACHQRNTSLAIAANVFTYVGTIILFMINWFFVQRIIRAQHGHLGWSTQYRIFHRAGLGLLVTTLIMLIVGAISQFFTLNEGKLKAFRALQLTGQTYFTIFCFAPAVLVVISLLLPRREIEKFGAGRLRVNIIILLLAVTVLFMGQLFRCILAWIPQTPQVDAAGHPVDTPWYLHKACFWIFNFVTEIIVVILFAVVRVDLRFHIPNGSRLSGDYSGRNSRVTVNHIPSEKELSAAAPIIPTRHNGSSETIHKYQNSVFDDSNTLADSLRYGGSTLEVDEKTGNWKVKRISGGSVSSHDSVRSSRSSLHDRVVTFADEDIPPVPELPTEWPLPDSPPPRSSVAALEHSNPPSRKSTPKPPRFEVANHHLNGVDMGDAITDALLKLEQNSEQNQVQKKKSQNKFPIKNERSSATPPPDSNSVSHKTAMKEKRRSGPKNPLAPRDRSTVPPRSALKQARSYSNANSTTSTTPTLADVPEVPRQPEPELPRHPELVAAPNVIRTQRPSSLELITLTQKPSTNSLQILDMSLQGDNAGEVSRPDTKDGVPPVSEGSTSVGVTRAPSSAYSGATTSSDAREAAVAEEEFRKFSSEGLPVLDGDLMRERRFD